MKTDDIRHIIWDWNGTLLDDVAACVEAMNCMLAKRRLGVLSLERYREIFGFPVRDYYRELGFDLEHEDWDALAKEFHFHYDITARTASLREGILPVLKALKGRGVCMSILSASETSILQRMLGARGIASHFSKAYGLDNLHAASKLSLGFRLLEEVAVPARRVLLIGDTIHDHDVASELGCRCLLLGGGHQSDARLTACGCAVVKSPAEIQAVLDGGPEGRGEP